MSEELCTDITAGEKYCTDLLVEAKVKGEDSPMIVHIEHSSYAQPSFPERIFVYFSRLFEKHLMNLLPVGLFNYRSIRD